MRVAATIVFAALALAATGCEGPDLGVPWDFERMLQQPRYEAYGESRFFADGRAMRPPPPHTRPYMPAPAPEEARPEPDADLLRRGRRSFETFCSACHGIAGYAGTVVAEAMQLRPPPSLHEAAIRQRDAGYIHGVIRNGFGLMPSYAELVRKDAWAVAFYVKALQWSQRVPLEELPPELQRRARAEVGGAGGSTQ